MGVSKELNEIICNLKKKIQYLLENGMLSEVKIILHEYRKVAPSDVEIYSIEAVVAMMEGNLFEASKYLENGIIRDKKNVDLLYNTGQLYEIRGMLKEAISYFMQARDNTLDKSLIQRIDTVIVELESGIQMRQSIKKGPSSSLPLVSVIIPTYNMKEYLKDAIDSVLFQDYENLEIVVADDCSTDGTQEMMIKQYIQNPKITYIRNENNLGAKINSRKLLHEYVHGKYVLGINHDDYLIKNNYISRAVHLLESNANVSLVFANVKVLFVASGQTHDTNVTLPEVTNGLEYFLNYEADKKYPHITSVLTSIYRRADAIRMGCLLEETQSQDTFLYLKLMLAGDIGFVQDCVGVYRMHDESISSNMPTSDDYSTIVEFEKLYKHAVELGLEKIILDQWIQVRVYSYVRWRFYNIWKNDRTTALRLLLSISERYPNVYESIMVNLHLN